MKHVQFEFHSDCGGDWALDEETPPFNSPFNSREEAIKFLKVGVQEAGEAGTYLAVPTGAQYVDSKGHRFFKVKGDLVYLYGEAGWGPASDSAFEDIFGRMFEESETASYWFRGPLAGLIACTDGVFSAWSWLDGRLRVLRQGKTESSKPMGKEILRLLGDSLTVWEIPAGSEFVEVYDDCSDLTFVRIVLLDPVEDGLLFGPSEPSELNPGEIEALHAALSKKLRFPEGSHDESGNGYLGGREMTIRPTDGLYYPELGVVRAQKCQLVGRETNDHVRQKLIRALRTTSVPRVHVV